MEQGDGAEAKGKAESIGALMSILYNDTHSVTVYGLLNRCLCKVMMCRGIKPYYASSSCLGSLSRCSRFLNTASKPRS